MAMATTVRAPAKMRNRRSILVLLFHHGTYEEGRDEILKILTFADMSSMPKVCKLCNRGETNYHSQLRSQEYQHDGPKRSSIPDDVGEGNRYVG